MTPELWQLFLAIVAYLGLLFLVAYAAEEGWLPARVARHPMTYALSLGVYATTWSYYGSVGFASSQGYLFLTIYIGVTLAFALTPVLLKPLLRLVRDYQLTSLADLFAFRYPSRFTGVLVTLFMLMGILPYISLQIQAVTTSVRVLTTEAPPQVLALLFCMTVTLFAVLFGARQVTPREKHEGLVVAIAFESVVKLLALLAVAAFALFGVFDGPRGLNEWLAAHPEAVARLYEPIREGAWPTLLLLAFSAAFLLPRQFHMIFTENIDPRTLRTASWAFPVFLLLLNLAIPLFLWAGQHLRLDVAPDFYMLALTQLEPTGWLTFFTFIGGISAASAMMIVESLALAAMVLNHLFLPLRLAVGPPPSRHFYRGLLWARRALIAIIIFAGYATYVAVEHTESLAQLGLISFVAVAQFLPAVIGMLCWPGATRVGFLAGVSGGMLAWFTILVLPLLQGTTPDHHLLPLYQLFPLPNLDRWSFATFWSLALNMLLFIGGSLLSKPTVKEVVADRACRLDAVLLISPVERISSVEELQERLTPALGRSTAHVEVNRALADLRLNRAERRPRQLQFLRERVERNLSGLLGPQLARSVLADRTSNISQPRQGLLVEEELEHSRSRLSGLAAELDHLRRSHRQILQHLPIGACSCAPDGTVQLWNERMAAISEVPEDTALGTAIADLPAPWSETLGDFLASGEPHRYKLRTVIDGRTHWLNLHREAVVTANGDPRSGGLVLLVEDLTEQHRLEAEMAHTERLASIGLLAAGVAHEIGNPLTGITSVAQNLLAEQRRDGVQDDLHEILSQSHRIRDIVRSLLSFSHAGHEHRTKAPFLLYPCAEEAVRLMRLLPAGRQIDYTLSIPPDLQLEADRGQILQVFVNLLSNAVDASAPGASIQISASSSAEGVRIEVRDEGAGIPEGLRDRVFEPFFTTKDPGRGTGLGLPLVYSILRDHGGSVRVDSQEGLGTCVSLDFPTPGIRSAA